MSNNIVKRDGVHAVNVQIGTTGHALDPRGIDHPSHYNGHKSGIEVIEVARYLSFDVGNAFKYVMRRGEKAADGLTRKQAILKDLDKALWYLSDAQTNGIPAYDYNDAGVQGLVEHRIRQFITAEPNAYVRAWLFTFLDCSSGSYQTLLYMITALQGIRMEAEAHD